MTNAKNLLVLNVFSIKIIKIISALITLLDKSIICCRFWLFAIRKSDLHAQMNIKLLESIELRYYTHKLKHTHTHTLTHTDIDVNCTCNVRTKTFHLYCTQ